ncbi:MAG TPA: hypothetical protein PKD85_07145 [Saprospiraceae bacterium]|nr:hypothetical protein [Saprospiraceae bacterium]
MLIIFAINFHSFELYGQSRSFAGLPQLKPKSPLEYQDHLNDTEEYYHILNIYERLVEAKGDKRMPVPKLSLRKEEGYVASMDYRLLDISLEKKAYDVAKKYGDSGIAFLLAHELVHYYEKHGWRNQFADESSDLKTGKLLAKINDDLANEVQADVLGGFLAYSAGFGLFDKGGDLISELYAAYKMKDNLKGYPSKKERIELANRTQSQVEQMSAIFETAMYLTIIGKFETAYVYYGYLLNRYQSKEIYNNAGLTALLAATAKIDPKLLIFEFPMIFDIEFSGSSRNSSAIEEAQKLLHEAIILFETSILMNPAYITPYINKSTAYIMLHLLSIDLESKLKYLSKAKHTLSIEASEAFDLNDYDLNVKFIDHFNVLNSIQAYLSGEKDLAIHILQESVDRDHQLAIRNLNVMMHGPLTQSKPTPFGDNHELLIDGMNAKKFLELRMVSKNISRINDKNQFRFVNQKNSSYQVHLHEFKGDDQNFGFQICFLSNKNVYQDKVFEDLKIGHPKEDFIETLGKPIRYYSHLNGEVFLFQNNIITISDSQGIVTKIINYAVKQN